MNTFRQKLNIFSSNHGLILVIILIAFVARLYRIDFPLADWHSFRQADTASVTREYVKNGINLLVPEYHDMSNIQSGKDNLNGYRMVEFPFVNGFIALLIRTIPQLDLVVTSRVVSVLFSMGTLVSIYGLVTKLSSRKQALLASLIFALMPYSIYYSRVILPEPAMLFFATFSIYTFKAWLDSDRLWFYLASLISLALALLLKPFVAFLGLVYLVLAWQKWSFKTFIQPSLVLFGAAFVPMYLWRKHILNYPAGIPASDWLFNGNGIRFRPAWFRWLFWERLAKLITGLSGIILLPLGLLKFSKQQVVYIAWWLGIGLYFSIMATGNVQHDYYQVLTIPIISMTMASGVFMLIKLLTRLLGKEMAISSTVVLLIMSWIYSWNLVGGYFNVNHWEYVRAGHAVDTMLPKDAKVIAPAFGDTVFLFQTNRRGWPIGFLIEEKIGLGATHYVSTSLDDETRELIDMYQVIEQNEEFVIIDLTKPIMEINER